MRYWLSIAFVSLFALGQAQTYQNPDDLIQDLFKALQEENDSVRGAGLEKVFMPDGRFNVIIYHNSDQSRIHQGTWRTFLNESKDFYDAHKVGLDEIDRTIDYYQDLAHIHGELFQTMREESGNQDLYEEILWYHLQLAYIGDGWKAISLSWVNAWDGEPMEETISSDTIWFKPNR